jgi:hypothetical protein
MRMFRGLSLASIALAIAACTTEVDDSLPPPPLPATSEAALSSPEVTAFD